MSLSDVFGSWLFAHYQLNFMNLVWLNAGTTALALVAIPSCRRGSSDNGRKTACRSPDRSSYELPRLVPWIRLSGSGHPRSPGGEERHVCVSRRGKSKRTPTTGPQADRQRPPAGSSRRRFLSAAAIRETVESIVIAWCWRFSSARSRPKPSSSPPARWLRPS